MSQAKGKFPLKKTILAASAALVVLLLGILAFWMPFSRLLPAYELPAREEGEVRLHFLDVGQGDCTLIEFEDELFVVDSGDGSFSADNKLLRYIKGLRPQRVTLVLTHADMDHYGGFSALCEAFDIARCYLPVLPSENEHYEAFLAAIEREGCETATLTRYDKIEKRDGYLVCISPRSAGETDENDSSTVLYLELGGVTALLCGDISETRERLLLREYALSEGIFDSGTCQVALENVDILKAPHHASAYSSSKEFLELLRPQTYIVSCGEDNLYKHPAGEALERFRAASPSGEIYRTDELGDLIVSVKNGTYTVNAR